MNTYIAAVIGLVIGAAAAVLAAKNNTDIYQVSIGRDSDNSVICWIGAHHQGMSCLPEWMLLPGTENSPLNISSANINTLLKGQKDTPAP